MLSTSNQLLFGDNKLNVKSSLSDEFEHSEVILVFNPSKILKYCIYRNRVAQYDKNRIHRD